ncbi:MAG: N-methyl-L-tryptophan oxidase [Acidobacteria bacterium]|nr:MAG: N-methyl-L-tryptophan oxidase [Acidobacteriota bacterium]REJ98035.1 MAG: N-methyl-L-tryptophan oxidase [Acidobacteriota bacterium]REK16778.1 MAG: N-methyl-L-tryptophan oxidase [Acidobacteriota bacterium]REK42689.1 MAG: N-methyl-L-tryptophan oxidase [Acidobacteriota bacterium]
MKTYDVIVAGLGAMGSAALFQLAKSRVKVLGIDRFSPPHDLGSTHGETRLTRLAIGEGEEFVPLVMRTNEVWRELEEASGNKLLTTTGGLIFTSGEGGSVLHGSDILADTIRIARNFGIKHDILDHKELESRFHDLKFEPNSRGYYEYGSGYLNPELCIETNLGQARVHGAETAVNERIIEIDETDGKVEIITSKDKYECSRLLLSAGAWVNKLLGDRVPEKRFRIFRQVMIWFRGLSDYSDASFPVFIKGGSDEHSSYYGFPAVEGSDAIKIGIEQFETESDPDAVDRSVSETDTRKAFELVSKNFNIEPDPVKIKTCLYTVTEDFGFVVDFLPGSANILVVSPCSGHGFKHSAGIGQLAKQMVLGEEPFTDVSRFRFENS